MKTKALEIRDRMTFIPAMAVDMNPDAMDIEGRQRYLLRRCGYKCDGSPNVVVARLDGDGRHAFNDPYDHTDRTWRVAHGYIIEHWDELQDGDVIDVEFILGETTTKKISERIAP